MARCIFENLTEKQAAELANWFSEQGDEWIDIYKDPIDSSKKSKRGRLKLTLDQNFKYHTVAHDAPGDDQLVTIFENGELLVDQSFSDIRKRAELV